MQTSEDTSTSINKTLSLHHWILLALFLGAALGLPLNWAGHQGIIDTATVGKVANVGKEIGDLFLRLLQMLVVPLIVASLITGITSMGNLKALGRLGGRAITYYLCTSMLAILTGLLVVNLIQPGVGADLELLQATSGEGVSTVAEEATGVGAILWQQIKTMVPKNPLAAAANGQMLPLIFFSLLLGVFISLVMHSDDDKAGAAGTLSKFFEGLFAVMMRMTMAVIQLAPLGVFGFMLFAAAGKGINAFVVLGWYALAVAAGLAIHALITLPTIAYVFARKSAVQHAKTMAPALLTAFSTASSNGTLPLTMHNVEKAGVSPRVSAFVLPLGATINMDGTALYEVVAVLFIAQVYGIDLSLSQQVIVALTALSASIGAAGIPHAGAVMMVVVLSAVGLPTSAVGLILAVDRILDMARTTVNVWSDSIAALVVDRHA